MNSKESLRYPTMKEHNYMWFNLSKQNITICGYIQIVVVGLDVWGQKHEIDSGNQYASITDMI